MKRIVCLIILACSIVLALLYGGENKSSVVYCKKDLFAQNGADPSFTYIYNWMFLGCRPKTISTTSKKIVNDFYETGTGHLLSISGLHVGSVAFFVYFLLGSFLYLVLGYFNKRHLPFFYVSMPIGFLVAVLYVGSIGVEVPRLRSLLMLGMVFLSFFVPLFKDKLSVVFLAAALVLFMMPGSIFSYSFHYSFIAVFALIFCKPKGVLSASFCVSLFLIPLNLHSSGGFNLLHIVNNAVVIPVFSFFYFPAALTMVALVYLGASWSTVALDGLTRPFVWGIGKLSILSHCTGLKLAYIGLLECLCLYALLLFFRYLFYEPREISFNKCRYIYLLVFVLTLALVAVLCTYLYKGDSITNFYLERKKGMNGSGDLVVGTIGGKTFVVDTGPGERPTTSVLKELSRKKIDAIDYLLLTHDHIDHLGGLKVLLQEISVGTIVVPPFMLNDLLKLHSGARVLVVCNNSLLRLNNNDVVRFHTPSCRQPKLHQELSFSIDTGTHLIAFLSDLKISSSRKVLLDIHKYKRTLNVLQLSHHCSVNDNSIAGLNRFSPDLGFCNRHKSLFKSMLNLEKLDFPVLVAGQCGDTEFSLSSSGIRVSSKKCSTLSLHTP